MYGIFKLCIKIPTLCKENKARGREKHFLVKQFFYYQTFLYIHFYLHWKKQYKTFLQNISSVCTYSEGQSPVNLNQKKCFSSSTRIFEIEKHRLSLLLFLFQIEKKIYLNQKNYFFQFRYTGLQSTIVPVWKQSGSKRAIWKSPMSCSGYGECIKIWGDLSTLGSLVVQVPC